MHMENNELFEIVVGVIKTLDEAKIKPLDQIKILTICVQTIELTMRLQVQKLAMEKAVGMLIDKKNIQ